MPDPLRDSLDAFYAQQTEAMTKPDPGASLCGWKPLISDALAVHPSQIPEAIEDAKRKGLGEVDFLKDGRPRFNSRGAFNAYLKAYGFFNKDAGYGDVADGTYRGRKPEVNDLVPQELVSLMYSGTGKRLR